MFAQPRRLTPAGFQAASAEFEHMLQLGITRPSESPWASHLHMDFVGAHFGKAAFSKIGLVRAFHQSPVVTEDIPKTAITTPFGLLQFTCMPFGRRNAAQTPQRFIDRSLYSLPFVYVSIDVLLVASQNAEELTEELALVLKRLDKYGVVINPSNFLGCTRIRTTAASGMVERVHRSACRIRPKNLVKQPPLVLPGLCAALNSDLNYSAAELVFGTTLQLPGKMVTPTSRGVDETPDNFVYCLR
nr:unnamed protein product [Spirometra erinaceieuropaei]